MLAPPHAAEQLLNPGSTPLHFACAHNHAAVARLLLAYGAAPHVPDKRGVTPLDLLPPASSITASTTPPPSDLLRSVIREYYENEKAKEKEFQKNQIRFYGKAAAVLGFPRNEDDHKPRPGGVGVSGGLVGRRSVEHIHNVGSRSPKQGVMSLTSPKHVPVALPMPIMTSSSPSPARRGIPNVGTPPSSPRRLPTSSSERDRSIPSSPPSPSPRYTFGSATPTPTIAAANNISVLAPPSHAHFQAAEHRRPSLPHIFESSSNTGGVERAVRPLAATSSSSESASGSTESASGAGAYSYYGRPRSADGTDAPAFGAVAVGMVGEHRMGVTTNTVSAMTHAHPHARPRTKRSLLSLFKKAECVSDEGKEREREKEERESGRGRTASSTGLLSQEVKTAPAERTTFPAPTVFNPMMPLTGSGGARDRPRVPEEVFCDDDVFEDYGVPLVRRTDGESGPGSVSGHGPASLTLDVRPYGAEEGHGGVDPCDGYGRFDEAEEEADGGDSTVEGGMGTNATTPSHSVSIPIPIPIPGKQVEGSGLGLRLGVIPGGAGDMPVPPDVLVQGTRGTPPFLSSSAPPPSLSLSPPPPLDALADGDIPFSPPSLGILPTPLDTRPHSPPIPDAPLTPSSGPSPPTSGAGASPTQDTRPSPSTPHTQSSDTRHSPPSGSASSVPYFPSTTLGSGPSCPPGPPPPHVQSDTRHSSSAHHTQSDTRPSPTLSTPHLSPRTRPGILRGDSSVRRSGSRGALRFEGARFDGREGASRFEGGNTGGGGGGGGTTVRKSTSRGSLRERTSPCVGRSGGGTLKEKSSGSSLRTPYFGVGMGAGMGGEGRLRGDSLSSGMSGGSHDTSTGAMASMGTIPSTPSLDPDTARGTCSSDDDEDEDEDEDMETPELGLSLRTVSNHAQAEALVQKAAKEILELNALTEGSKLSAQLAAYGETLQLERRFARGEAQRYKSPTRSRFDAADPMNVGAYEDAEEGELEKERRRDEERGKKAQERMLWSQKTLERYARGGSKERRSPEVAKEREREPALVGCPLERTTSLEKEIGTVEGKKPKKPRSPKMRRPHTSDSVGSTGKSIVPCDGVPAADIGVSQHLVRQRPVLDTLRRHLRGRFVLRVVVPHNLCASSTRRRRNNRVRARGGACITTRRTLRQRISHPALNHSILERVLHRVVLVWTWRRDRRSSCRYLRTPVTRRRHRRVGPRSHR